MNHIGTSTIVFLIGSHAQVSEQVTVRNLGVFTIHIQTATTDTGSVIKVVYDDKILQFYSAENTHTSSSVTVGIFIVDDVTMTDRESVPFGILIFYILIIWVCRARIAVAVSTVSVTCFIICL